MSDEIFAKIDALFKEYLNILVWGTRDDNIHIYVMLQYVSLPPSNRGSWMANKN